MRKLTTAIFMGFIATAVVPEFASAEEFRVESKVFVGDAETPVSDSLTLFHEGRVYDLLSSPPEITVFDLSQGRIVLLDPVRKLRVELKPDRLTAFVEQLRVRASRQPDPFLKFAAEPKFAETADDEGWLKFASPHLTYRVRGTRSNSPATVQAYREFADWTVRLKTRVDQGAAPPFPRLAVNAALERQGLLPDEVELTITPSGRTNATPTVLRSEHQFEPRLYTADRKRIEEANRYAADFRLAPLGQYLQPAKQARR